MQESPFLQSKHPNEGALLMYFSNGGAFVHELLLQVLAEDAARHPRERLYPDVKIAATAFDSTPTWLSLRSASLAVSEGIRNPILRAVAFALMWISMIVYVPFVSGINRPRVYFDNMARDHLACPSLYIYSSTDRITDMQKLADLIERRRKSHVGGPDAILELLLHDSPHVGHIRKHPEKYRDALAKLLTVAAAADKPALAADTAANSGTAGGAGPLLSAKL